MNARTVLFGLLAGVLAGVLASSPAWGQEPDRDRDGDGLSDFHEVHKYLTDPAKKDSDGDGLPDGDWRERREYQYTIRTVVQVMRPVTPEFLSDDYQDARVLDETQDHVELEVIHYPFNTVASAIEADKDWRATAKKMAPWTKSGPTADWTAETKREIEAALLRDGIDAKKLDDKALVEAAAPWLCRHAQYQDSFTTFITAFDEKGKPYVPAEIAPGVPASGDAAKLASAWERDLSARGMFEHKQRGSCSSSAIYMNGCLRALGVPTRIVLCIPLVDANDERELGFLERGLSHRALRGEVTAATQQLKGSWASHTFNEVFVGGRWRRLNYDKLGQDIRDSGLFGVMTHVATFSDWADAHMPDTIGKRQTFRRNDDLFGFANPYSAISLRDEFGPHCKLANDVPAAQALRITALHWGDSEDVPADVRGWFAEHGVFGLVARIEGAENGEALRRFLAASDQRVLLVADGKPTLGIGIDGGSWWFKQDHALIVVPFGAADRQGLATDVPYRFVTRNAKPEATWKVDERLRVTRKS